MIHDAIFLLWDCHNNSELSSSEQYYNENIAELHESEKNVFHKIVSIAKCHGRIKRFIKKNSFASGRNRRHSSHTSNRNIIYKNSQKARSEATSSVRPRPHMIYLSEPISTKPIGSPTGLYIQALTEGLEEILEPYRLQLVQLEGTALANLHLPLSHVLGSVYKFKPLLNKLNVILFSIKERRLSGCQILHVLQQHALNGNEETTTALNRLIFIVHKVFYEQLCSWLLYGSLKDNAKEFIIHRCDSNPPSSPTINSSKLSSLHSTEHSRSSLNNSQRQLNKWIDYEINAIMLPYYIPVAMAQKILYIGNTVVLFDSSPIDTNNVSSIHLLPDMNKSFTIWGAKEPCFHQAIQELKNADQFNITKLDTLLDEIKLCVTEHLWVVANEEAGVLHELQVMKDYFLLGRGELFLELLRLGEPLLNSSPTPVSTRDMNLAFNAAARAVLLGNSKDILKFSFSIPYHKHDASNSDADFEVLDGWSTVVLQYKVKWPLHLLFSPEVLGLYNEIFRFLLRVKKTQHDLHLIWFIYKKSKRHVSSAWQLHNKLMFLMDHLQHYLQADVLESNYSKLKAEAEKLKDFDLLKKAHNTFLTDILSQAFLLMNPLSEDSMEKEFCSDYRSNPVMSNIMDVLELCDAFCSMANVTTDPEEEEYHITGYTIRFESLVGKLLNLLTALRMQPCGTYLARLLMRLEFNRWFSGTAHLTQSVTSML